MGECLCDRCAALCCRYFALPIDNPTTRKDFDNVRWYLLHENVTIFVEKGQWYIGIANRCKQVQADNRCGIYDTRPQVCRKYSTDNCDWHGGEYSFDWLFTSAQQLEKFAAEMLAEERAKKRKKKTRSRGKQAKGSAAKRSKPNLKRLSEALERKMSGGTATNGNGRDLSLTVLRQ